jgi:hypothetical protein
VSPWRNCTLKTQIGETQTRHESTQLSMFRHEHCPVLQLISPVCNLDSGWYVLFLWHTSSRSMKRLRDWTIVNCLILWEPSKLISEPNRDHELHVSDAWRTEGRRALGFRKPEAHINDRALPNRTMLYGTWTISSRVSSGAADRGAERAPGPLTQLRGGGDKASAFVERRLEVCSLIQELRINLESSSPHPCCMDTYC